MHKLHNKRDTCEKPPKSGSDGWALGSNKCGARFNWYMFGTNPNDDDDPLPNPGFSIHQLNVTLFMLGSMAAMCVV